jgi:hypothetical protein
MFTCRQCGNNWPAEHRKDDMFIRARGLPQRYMLHGEMFLREKPADHDAENAAEGNLQL